MKKPLIAVVGPTSSGKSDIAVVIAYNFSGEVVSADSRQVYRGLDIGSGKITKEEMKGIPHHMLDVVHPENRYTVQQYKKDAEKVIDDIYNRSNLPIVCGGTGFYISSLIDNIDFPKVAPDSEFREKCEKEDPAVLFEQLKDKDPRRAETIDPKNKQRVIRALEIVKHFGSVPGIEKKGSFYRKLIIGLDMPTEELEARIEQRLLKRLDLGMVQEARRLQGGGLSFERMEELGIEYRFLAKYLKKEITKSEMEDNIKTASIQYAKKQRQWFKKDDRIRWFHPEDVEEICESVDHFLHD